MEQRTGVLLGKEGEKKILATYGLNRFREMLLPQFKPLKFTWGKEQELLESTPVDVITYEREYSTGGTDIYVETGVEAKIWLRREMAMPFDNSFPFTYDGTVTYSETSSLAPATIDTIWTSWSDSTSAIESQTSLTVDTVWKAWNILIQQRPETEEERRARELRIEAQFKAEADQRKKLEEAERLQKEVEKRALDLLLDNLDANQKEIFEKTGAIPVLAKSGRRYRISKGTSQNIKEVNEKDEIVKRLCFHPVNSWELPVYDVMLSQKLMLEICEEEARKIANFS